MSTSGNDPKRAIRSLNLVGFVALLVLFGGFGGWAATAKLSGAVIAPGTLVVESHIKKVQHPTGGIVGEILVKEGDHVQENQVIIRLDDTVPRATLGIVRSQLDELLSREARLIAERDGGTTIPVPEELKARRGIPTVEAALFGDTKLFESRFSARAGQRSQLQERVAQINEEIRGLSSQLEAKESEIKFIAEELTGVTELYKKNLIPIIRYMQLQRDHAKLNGERGQFIADIARAKGKISEIELQIIQLDQDFRTEVLRELRETQGKIAELRERVVAAEDQLRRVELRAPQKGIVHQLAVHTVGGVIGNGETIMQIVPESDQLVVEAKVSPQDIDQVSVGAKVAVRIMAGNQRTMPELSAVLTRVSPDLTREPQTNLSYYLVRASLDPESLSNSGHVTLVPGMPADAFIQTDMRTPLQYLLKPLREQIARTFRER
jgi:HlyD family secretion protein